MDDDFERQLRGERLTTTEVLYYMPDCPALLQRFLWQTLDLAPRFPRVRWFLDFWRREIDATIHSVTVASPGLIQPARLRIARHMETLHQEQSTGCSPVRVMARLVRATHA